MTTRLLHLDSAEQIRSAAAQWNDLWQRSEVALPVARAELVAHWLDRHAARASVRAIALEQDGRFVALLPLVRGRLKGALPIARMPYNDWSWAGDLLLDPSIDSPTLTRFAKEVARNGRPLVWLDAVPFATDRWRQFSAAAVDAGLSVNTHESFCAARIEIDHEWSAYERCWSKNHRRQMRRIEREAHSHGGATLVVHRSIAPDEVEPLVRRGFEIEDSGWKGRAGSSALSSPRTFEHYLEQARLVAAGGQLQITFLNLHDRPIAFEYGWNAKGVYHSLKIGYDETFARLAPGQLLRLQLLRRLFGDPEQRAFDFLGPVTKATAKWATSTYPVGRCVMSDTRLGRLFIRAYRLSRPAPHNVVCDHEKTTPGGQAKSQNRRAPAPLT